MGHGLIFQAWGFHQYIAITPERSRCRTGEVLFRANSMITRKQWRAFTFATSANPTARWYRCPRTSAKASRAGLEEMGAGMEGRSRLFREHGSGRTDQHEDRLWQRGLAVSASLSLDELKGTGAASLLATGTLSSRSH